MGTVAAPDGDEAGVSPAHCRLQRLCRLGLSGICVLVGSCCPTELHRMPTPAACSWRAPPRGVRATRLPAHHRMYRSTILCRYVRLRSAHLNLYKHAGAEAAATRARQCGHTSTHPSTSPSNNPCKLQARTCQVSACARPAAWPAPHRSWWQARECRPVEAAAPAMTQRWL